MDKFDTPTNLKLLQDLRDDSPNIHWVAESIKNLVDIVFHLY